MANRILLFTNANAKANDILAPALLKPTFHKKRNMSRLTLARLPHDQSHLVVAVTGSHLTIERFHAASVSLNCFDTSISG